MSTQSFSLKGNKTGIVLCKAKSICPLNGKNTVWENTRGLACAVHLIVLVVIESDVYVL